MLVGGQETPYKEAVPGQKSGERTGGVRFALLLLGSPLLGIRQVRIWGRGGGALCKDAKGGLVGESRVASPPFGNWRMWINQNLE